MTVDLDLPDFRHYALEVPSHAATHHESPRQLGQMLRDTFTRTKEQTNLRIFCPDELTSNRLGDVLDVENRVSMERSIDNSSGMESATRTRCDQLGHAA